MRLTFTDEALRRMRERGIPSQAVEGVITTGQVIREYPDDQPFPSRLALGWIDRTPLHVVYALNVTRQEHVVITTYYPDPALWDATFTRRVQR